MRLTALSLVAALAAGVAVTADQAASAPHYNAPPVAPNFILGTTTVPLRPRCMPERVAQHLISRLDAFDSGRARAFSRAFPASSAPATNVFRPYSGEALPGYRDSLSTRPGVERIVRALYRRGDGWTALRLDPPQGNPLGPGRAVYGLGLRVTRRHVPQYETGAKIVINCTTGRVIRWLGPVGPQHKTQPERRVTARI
jgi:hypothetical protein